MTRTFPNTSRLWVAVAAAALLAAPASAQPKPDVNEATEKAMKAASAKVAPTVVKIETAGGAELVTDAPKKGGLIASWPGVPVVRAIRVRYSSSLLRTIPYCAVMRRA